MDFYSKRRKVRRQAHEREESKKNYMANKDEIDSRREATAIHALLSRISYTAKLLTVEDILSKVSDRKELDFYYRCIMRLWE